MVEVTQELRDECKAEWDHLLNKTFSFPMAVEHLAQFVVSKTATLTTENAALAARVEALEGENRALLEVDRLAEIASAWHWWGALECCDYEDKDDLFQDLDFARATARATARAALAGDPS